MDCNCITNRFQIGGYTTEPKVSVCGNCLRKKERIMESVYEKHVAITFNSISNTIVFFTMKNKVMVFDGFTMSVDDPVLQEVSRVLEVDVHMVVETLQLFYKRVGLPIQRKE